MKDHSIVEVFWSDKKEGFIVFSPELPVSSAWGATREVALNEIEIAIELWIQVAQVIGGPLPARIFPPFQSKSNAKLIHQWSSLGIF